MRTQEYGWHFLTSVLFVVLAGALCFVFGDRIVRIPIFDFFVLALATFRLTHLFVYDIVMDFVRDYFDQFRRGLGRSMSELIHCPWCTSTWMALVVFFLYVLTPYSKIFLWILALAGAGVIIEIVILNWKK